jgi:DNA-binding transcriptional regulator YiaG
MSPSDIPDFPPYPYFSELSGNELRSLRERTGLHQVEIARATGYTARQVRRLEHKDRLPLSFVAPVIHCLEEYLEGL